MKTAIRLVPLQAFALAVLASTAAAVTVTRGPYLQTPTPHGIVVRWRTDVPTDSRVRTGAAPGSLATIIDDPTPTTEHVVTLGGLAPDTDYYYSVGSAGGALLGDDPAYRLRTFPLPGPARPTRIWAIGDAGFAGPELDAVRNAYASFTGSTPTDLWLLLGDNAYLVGSDANYQAAVFDPHRDLLRRVAPWPTFGNHEGFSSNALTGVGPYFNMFTLPTAGEAGGVPSGTESYYSFDFANVHVVVLDGNSSSTVAGSPMRTWLDADLSATTADWVIAMWHQPPYSKGQFHDSDVETREILMRQNVLPVLDAHGVDLVLNGHSHSYERSHLLDGFYGTAVPPAPSMVLDGGDGRVGSDGPYRKATIGPAPHEGAVYVVAGSSSETRPITAGHPAMEIGLSELGSLVVDVNGDTLAGTFLQANGVLGDTFRIVKGHGGPTSPCTAAPVAGCVQSTKASLMLRKNAIASRDGLAWKWKGAAVPPGAVGNPPGQDFAICVYDASGRKAGGRLAPGAAWSVRNGDFTYHDKYGVFGPMGRARIMVGAASRAQITASGKGAGLGLVTASSTAPLRAQLVNLDAGGCWESTFPTIVRQTPSRLQARQP